MIRLLEGSILEATTDVIVNPANSFLRHGGGLAKIIAAAATEGLNPEDKAAWWAEQHNTPSIPTGAAVLGKPGALPFCGIIHAVGPIWGGGTYFERELLARVVRNIGDICVVNGYKSVALPAISCGLFRFPVDEAARIITTAARFSYHYGLRWDVHVLGDEHVQAFGKVIQA